MSPARAPGPWTLALALGVAATSCGDAGEGIRPPLDRLFFPSGLTLDPRTPDGAAPRWLFVANANSDLVYNAGTILGLDLDAFFAAWTDGALVDGRFEFATRDGLADVGAKTNADAPCRRMAGLPQSIECDERYFVERDATVRIGSFSTVLRPWDRRSLADKAADPNGYDLRLFVPVRGDPSITYVDVDGGLGGEPLSIECPPDPARPELCALDDRTRFLRGDRDLRRIGREPMNMVVTDRLALVTHNQVPEVTLLGLYGLEAGESADERGKPVVLDIQRLYGNTSYVGGFGLAERPCDPEDADGDGVADNAPLDTYVDGVACARPLFYGSNRNDASLIRFSIGRIVPTPEQQCVSVEDLDKEGAILCEDRLVPIDGLYVAGYDPGTTSSASLGEIAFSADGDRLYVVQSSPGALLRVDTSVDERGATRDVTTGIVELCFRPSDMIAFSDGGIDMAAVSCSSTGAIFVVDLASMRVVEQVFAGAGVHAMVHDPVRGFIYAANTLDATISVIDVAAYRPTRFTQVARIGLQEPYSG